MDSKVVKPSADPYRLPTIQWPFAKPGDPGIDIKCRYSTSGEMQGNGLFVEPVLMKGDQVVFEYGCGLWFKRLSSSSPDFNTLQVSANYQDGALYVFGTVDAPTANSYGFSPAIVGGGSQKVEEPKKWGPDYLADFRGVDPFAKLDQVPAFYGTAGKPLPPKPIGGKFAVPVRSLTLSYDEPSFARLIIDANLADVPEYGIAYLAACKFPNGDYALKKDTVSETIRERLKVNINDPNVARDSAIKKIRAIVNILNNSMVRWAKAGLCLADLQIPQDEKSGVVNGDVFASIRLPAQEVKLIQTYRTVKMSGPEKLVLRMTINRLLLDRLLVSGWFASVESDEKSPVGPKGRPNLVFRNQALQDLKRTLEGTYGTSMEMVVMQLNLNRFSVTARPTYLARSAMEPIFPSPAGK